MGVQSIREICRGREHTDAALKYRLENQWEFAKWLVEQKDAKPQWKTALLKAEKILVAGVSSPLSELVPQVEAALAPLGKAAKHFEVYCAGHAHIDMNWMWSWPETVALTLDSFRTALTLLDEFPEFHFSQSQSSVYKIVQDYEPAMMARIAEKVKEGRWEVTASHWVENDANMASGEALARHLQQTRSYMKQLFGLEAQDVEINWAPDTFGFAATTPGYLVQGGVKYVFMHRPGTWNQPVPEVFVWRGLDGASVLVQNAQRRGYNCNMDAGDIFKCVKSFHEMNELDFSLYVYGVGDHGGGPTRRDLLMAREIQAWPIFPSLRLSPTKDFFAQLGKVASKLPVIDGELNIEFAGCFTTQSLIKRANRLGEARMLEAEAASALAKKLLGKNAPSGFSRTAFDENWRKVLFTHFHDILPGSGVADTRTYCHGEFQSVMAFTSQVMAQNLRALAAHIDTASLVPAETDATEPPLFVVDGMGGGTGISAAEGSFGNADGRAAILRQFPFVVYNFTGHEREENIEFTLWDRVFTETVAEFRAKKYEAIDCNGKSLNAQFLSCNKHWGHDFKKYLARVRVPAMGYTTVVFRECEVEAAAPNQSVSLRSMKHHCWYAGSAEHGFSMENDFVRVVLSPSTGRIVSIFDKKLDNEMLDAKLGGAGLEYRVERNGGMSAWVINNSGEPTHPRLVKMTEGARGPLSATIEAHYEGLHSAAKIIFRLDAGSPCLKIEILADWVERGSADVGFPNLRWVVNTALKKPCPTYEIPFGFIERAQPIETDVPGLRWAWLKSHKSQSGLLIHNDSKYGHHLEGSQYALNLLRSSIDPDPLPDLGQHKIVLGMEPLSSDIGYEEIIARAQRFENPAWVVSTARQEGNLPTADSFLSVAGSGVVFSSLKLANDDSDSLLVRLYNVLDKPTKASLSLHKCLGNCEEIQYADLLENPTNETNPSKKISLQAHGICTVRFYKDK